MTKNPFRKLCCSVAIAATALISVGSLSAQIEQEESGIRVRALAFVLGVKAPKEVYAFDPAGGQAGGTRIRVKTFLNHEADMLPDGTRNVILTTDAEAASTQIPEKIVAKATLPEGMKSVILLFVPGSGKPGDPPFRLFPVDDTRKAFPEGSLKVLNMSPTEVVFQLEDEKFSFKSGSTQIIEEMPVGDGNLTDMRAFCRIGPGNEAKDWKRIASAQWVPPGKKRIFQVLFLDPISQEIRLRGFTDIAQIVR